MLKIFKMMMVFSCIMCINGEFLSSSFGQRVQERQKTGRRFVKENQELQTGILVVSVFPDSAAECAGIKVGDIILRINKRYVVSDVQEFVDFIKNAKGRSSLITIKRDGLKKNIIVDLPPAGQSPRLGVTLSNLSSDNQKLSANTALAQATRKVDYVPPSSLRQKLKEINVLKYVLIDKETDCVVFVGNYDPDYSSGPISYHDLLSDALKDPYPSFSFDIDHEIYRSQIREIQRIMDVEMRKISTDIEYGIEWMNKTMMSIIKSKDSIPEKLILEQRMRQKMGIEPDEWRAYFDWNPKSNTNTYSQYEKIGSFLGKLFTSLGIEERFGRALIVLHQAQREVRENTSNYETTSKLCGLLGTMDGLYEIRDDLGSNRINDETAGRRLWSLHYGALLKGFGVPSSKVDAMTDRYKKGYCWDEELAQAVEERYEFLTKEALRLHVFQSLIFSQDFLRTIYRNLPIAFSGVKLYGRSADSPLIRVMFDADYAFKYITTINPETVSIPGHQSSLEFLTAEENRLGISLPDEGGVRYWIKPGVVKMESFQDKSGVYFVSADLGIGAEPLRSHPQLNSFRESLNSYAAGLTKRYDAYARLYPSLHIMREAEKIIAFTRWVKKNNIVVKIDEFKP
ncbi:MAG: PDZ domain-containing protein, partial [Candidatus Saelkia tenebricola]|nr:PDZ domain-containing protein [Candidatus Saelkia tenebricola]